MTQSRKPAGSPGGTGGQYDTGTTGGAGDLPALGQLPDDDLPEVKADFDDPCDISVPGLEGKTRGYLRWEGDRAYVWVTTDYHDLQDFVRPVLDKRLAAQAADETTRWVDAHPLPEGVHETIRPILSVGPHGVTIYRSTYIDHAPWYRFSARRQERRLLAMNDGWRNLDINDDVDPADLGPAVERIVDENTEAMKPAE
ncbi:hypothetical protein [Bifidobacterium porcinum]|uniref:hypothetical protein n=1 Tax=Bifidobacterium porcinum TaxID=212365 RepID=UPI0039938853